MFSSAIRTRHWISLALMGLVSAASAGELENIAAVCAKELAGEERMIKICIRQESEAYLALSQYHPSMKPILDDCRKRVGKHGWTIQKMCADKQILAEKVIAGSS